MESQQRMLFGYPPYGATRLANALILAERRKRLTEADGLQIRELYGMLPIKTDKMVSLEIMGYLQALGRQYRLSACDAAYLELALRRASGFVRLDRNLCSAAEKAGVRTFKHGTGRE
jgi:predicted nucleic acid-binding protein